MESYTKFEGKLIFDPYIKNAPNLTERGWCLVSLNHNDICDYYGWFIKKRYNIDLLEPVWGPHVSFIHGEGLKLLMWEEFSKTNQKKTITVEISNQPRTNTKHWWLPVISPDCDSIRKELSLTQKIKFPLHLTLGICHPGNKNTESSVAKSLYVKNLYDKFGWDGSTK